MHIVKAVKQDYVYTHDQAVHTSQDFIGLSAANIACETSSRGVTGNAEEECGYKDYFMSLATS